MHSGLSLAKATLLLSELRGSDGQPLYLLTQKLLQQQVSLHLLTLVQSSTSATSGVSTFVFFLQLKTLGECVVQKAGGGLRLLSSTAWRNIYHPQLPLLAKTTMRLGKLHPSVFSTTYSYWEPGAYPKEHGAQGWVSSCILYSPET